MMNPSLLRRGSAKCAPLVALILCGAWACAPAERAPTTSFAGPTGMALAGVAFDRVYVANTGTDTLQIIKLQQDMRRIDLVPSPARFFPLNIPGGPNPKEVAASHDGRFVFVLDSITSTVRLIEADAEALVKDGHGQPLTLALGQSDVEASALVGAPWACAPSEADAQSDCLARAYVGLRRLNAIAAVDVRQAKADGSLSMVVDSTVAVGTAVGHLAVHSKRPALFMTNAQAPEVVRLNLGAQGGLTGAVVTRLDLRMPGGALAVSGDGQALAVARPAYRDVALFVSTEGDVASGTLVALDADPIRTPLPQCVMPCNGGQADACEDAHAADSALCSEPVGYGNGAHPYTALYLGSIPTAITPIDATVTGAPLPERCAAKGEEGVTAFDQAFAVASLDGTIEYIGLSRQDGRLSARLLDKASCEEPKVKSLPQSLTVVDQVLAPCAPLPEGRARMACLKDVDGDANSTGRVGLMRGHSDNRPIGLAWEGVLPGGDRSGGGGIIDSLGRLYDGGTDPAQDFAGLSIRVRELDAFGGVVYRGDVLQILTPQLASAACGNEGTSGSQLCQLERRIVALQTEGGRSRLVLDRPLNAACFNPGVQLAYRIRVGDSFLAGPIDESGTFAGMPVRLSPGQTYGKGLLAGATGPLFFTIDPKLEIGAELNACQRYLPGDSQAAGMPTWRSRNSLISFAVHDPFAPVRSGQATDPMRNVTVNSGQMPFAMVMTRGPTASAHGAVNPPVLLVSFAGSHSVLVASPLEAPASGGNEPKERLLQ